MSSPSELRAEIDSAIADEDGPRALELLRQLWLDAPSLSLASFVLSRIEAARRGTSVVRYRVALMRSFTVEPVANLLRAAGAVAGFDLTIELGEFGAYPGEILEPESRIHRFRPDAAILAVQLRDVAPDLWNRFADLAPEEVERSVDRVASDFRSWISTFRRHSSAHLLVHNMERPATPALGLLDARRGAGQVRAIERINEEIQRIARETRGVHVVDYEALIARHGRLAWHDEAKWLATRMPIAAPNMAHLANEWLRHLYPLAGAICKVLVTDLDNTLWGGVVGEDGREGIVLGVEYPGATYLAIQRALLDLRRRGVLLAVASKNNPADARDVIDHHPEMLLRSEDFAAFRISWDDKARSLREIANDLRVGVDALAFLDDSPTERQWVRRNLPDVKVIELGPDRTQWARTVLEYPWFERVAVSEEDRERTEYFTAERARDQSRKGAQSIEDFYRTLETEAEIAQVDESTLPRVAQLTQKTNQFNLTTRRYSEEQIARLAADPSRRVLWMRVRDRFGDHGIVGVSIDRVEGDLCEIDTFLLSCRVIGRTVETALLATVAEMARQRGAERMTGWYRPTPKNAPARAFYESHGFVAAEQDEGATRWIVDLARTEISTPAWIQRHVQEKKSE